MSVRTGTELRMTREAAILKKFDLWNCTSDVHRRVNIGVLRSHLFVPLFELPKAIEGFNRDHNTKVEIIAPRLADEALVHAYDSYKFWRFVCEHCGTIPTNILLVYEQKGAVFGPEVMVGNENRSIALQRARFQVPEEYRGLSGAIAVIGLQVDDFEQTETDVLIHISDSTRLKHFSTFPGEPGGDYYIDPETTVPIKEVPPWERKWSGRCPWRVRNAPNITTISRTSAIDGVYNQILRMSGSLFDAFSAVVEMSDDDVEKIEKDETCRH